MKVSVVKVKLFQDTSASNLETAINTWLTSTGERTFLAIEHRYAGANLFSAMVTYTE